MQWIPNKRTTMRNFHHTFLSKATLLHHSLKKLSNIIRQTKQALNTNSDIPTHHNTTILNLNSSHQLNLELLPTRHSLLPNWITVANTEWKNLYHAHSIENVKYTRQHISESIQK